MKHFVPDAASEIVYEEIRQTIIDINNEEGIYDRF